MTTAVTYHPLCYPDKRLATFEKELTGKKTLYILSIIAFVAVVIAAIVLTSIFSPTFVFIAILVGSASFPILIGLALEKILNQMKELKAAIRRETYINLQSMLSHQTSREQLQIDHTAESAQTDEEQESDLTKATIQVKNLQSMVQHLFDERKSLETSAPKTVATQMKMENLGIRILYIEEVLIQVKKLHSRVQRLSDEMKSLETSAPKTFATKMKMVNLGLRILYIEEVLKDPTAKIPTFKAMFIQNFRQYTPDQINQMVDGKIPYCTFVQGEEKSTWLWSDAKSKTKVD